MTYRTIDDTSREEVASQPVQHIIVSLIESGLSIFYKSFVEAIIDPDLFSAVLTAYSFVEEVHGSQGLNLDHETYVIDDQFAHICYGNYLAGIAVASGAVEDGYMAKLKNFITAYEDEYGFLLTTWDGDRSFFDHEWAIIQLREYLNPKEILYRLHEKPLSLSSTARQLRLILLVRRFVGSNSFSLDTLRDLLVRELDVYDYIANEFLTELANKGIILKINE
ncbi:MAG: hypothetical protein ACXADC_13040 [Candidatus Thorarchaeota archaeon]